MHIKTVTADDTGENTYIVDCGENAIVIDPGAEYEQIVKSIGGSKCAYVLLTHAHYDHICAAAAFARDGAKIYLHKSDASLLDNGGNLATLFGETLDSFVPDILLDGGEELELCGQKITVLHTPGHTEGSVCYLTEDVIFSGDTLFFMSVGRTDFPGGSAATLHASLDKLFNLCSDYKVLSGHGPATTLEFEKRNNPYV